jgi:putative YhgA-like transposase
MEHDNSYKALFSHPAMVADLIRGFVREDWVQQLDFSTLEKIDSNFITPGIRGRHSDVVWRLRWGETHWLYVYLLIEFQSTVDPYMALRLMVYVGLLYQHLIQQRQIPESGRLPAVLPLVLYNGDRPWQAARDVAELVEEVPGGLERYRPQLCYCLLDEGRMAAAELESLRNLAAALFRLENSHGPEEIERVLRALIDWLQEPELAELRRTLTTWIVQVLLPARAPGKQIPPVADLVEVRSMLAERVKEWVHDWREEGREKGREEGREEVLGEGRSALIETLEKRFGPLPDEARQRVASLDSTKKIVEVTASAATAPSLAALGLTES